MEILKVLKKEFIKQGITADADLWIGYNANEGILWAVDEWDQDICNIDFSTQVGYQNELLKLWINHLLTGQGVSKKDAAGNVLLLLTKEKLQSLVSR